MTDTASTKTILLGQYSATGTLDTTFGSASTGFINTQSGTLTSQITSIAISDSKILAAGWAKDPTGQTGSILARYTTSGTLDSSFAGGGVAFTQMGGTSHGNALAVQTIGTLSYIVVAGQGKDVHGSTEFALARYEPDNPAAQNLTYDSNGNMTGDQSRNTYSYDAWNRLATYSPADTATSYKETYYGYNALGERISEYDGVASGLTTPVLVINDGNTQRSMIDSLTVVFPSGITINSGYATGSGVFTTTGAFTLSNAGSTAVAVNYSNPSGDGQTWLIQFTSSFTTSNYGSLSDGGYTLTVNHSDVSGTGAPSSDEVYTFSRMAGDFVGDPSGEATVGFADLVIVAQNFGDPFPAGMWYSDTDHDGSIGFPELVVVGQNFGLAAPLAESGAILLGASATPSAEAIPFGIAPQEFYYSSQWQLLQQSALDDKTATVQTQSQNVWGLAYVNELVLRDRNTYPSSPGSLGISGSGLDERLYALQDANYNVVALVSTGGTVVERFDYTSYGTVTVLSASGVSLSAAGSLSGDSYNWVYLYQGGRTDIVTGFINFQHRDYAPVLDRWVTEDPLGTILGPCQSPATCEAEHHADQLLNKFLRRTSDDTQLWQYIDGVNLNQFVGDNPVTGTDPAGTLRKTEADCIKAYKDRQAIILQSMGPGFGKFLAWSGVSIGGGAASGVAAGSVWGGPVGGAVGLLAGAADELGALYDFSQDLAFYNYEIQQATDALKNCEKHCSSY